MDHDGHDGREDDYGLCVDSLCAVVRASVLNSPDKRLRVYFRHVSNPLAILDQNQVLRETWE